MGIPIDLYTHNASETLNGDTRLEKWRHDIYASIQNHKVNQESDTELDETSLYWHLYPNYDDQLTVLGNSEEVDIITKSCISNCTSLNFWFCYNRMNCKEIYFYIDTALQIIPLNHCYHNVQDINIFCELNGLLTIIIQMKHYLTKITCNLCSRSIEYPCDELISLNDIKLINYDLMPDFLLLLDSFGFIILNLKTDRKCFLGQIPNQINSNNQFNLLLCFPQIWVTQGSKIYFHDDLLTSNDTDWLQFDINPILQAYEKILHLHSVTNGNNLLVETNKRIVTVSINFLTPNDLQINIIKVKLQHDNEKIILSNDKKLILSIRKYHYNISIGIQQFSNQRNIWFSLGENDLTNKLNLDKDTDITDIVFNPQMQNQYIGNLIVMQETRNETTDYDNHNNITMRKYQSFNILKSFMETINQYDL